MSDECDEVFVKNFLRRVLIKKEFFDSKDKMYREYQKIKKRIDPVILLELTSFIALEEFYMMSDNHNLSDINN